MGKRVGANHSTRWIGQHYMDITTVQYSHIWDTTESRRKSMKRFHGLVIFLILFMVVGGVVVTANRATSSPDSIGLSLFFQNGQMGDVL